MAKINDLIAEGKLEQAANILYDAVLGIVNIGTPKMSLSREEWANITPSLITKMEDPTKGGSSPSPEPGDDIEILKDKARLTVNFVVPEGFKAPETMKKDIYVSLQYKVNAPEIKGCTPDKAFVTGTMTKDGATETFTYTATEPVPPTPTKKGTLTITYVGPDKSSIPFVTPEGVVREFNVGEEFMVESPTVEGFTPDKATVSGAMVEGGINETVTYTENAIVETGTLLISYEGPEGDPDWEPIDSYEHDCNVGEEFMVESPTVEGYTADKATVSGAMVKEGIMEVVTYTKDEE